ncbi:hypothetical protein [Enterobacter phage ZX14]|uniref:hypothetical protein n=1 Tax=Enterobacter phage vB_EclM_Q7622 TaxID=2908628 RepID=UPI00232993E0|nr:hypothetical protein PP425_gp287 [Enterobacter phage vB_EclM_Q7622]UIS65680.1 hypothetical protein Q76222_00173 [Enterobacter phage vB_EclM_Q7622]
MKTYKEFSQTEVITEGAITASEAKTAEAKKLAKAIAPLIKMGAPLESQLTKLSDEAREIGHADLKDAVDKLRKVLSPTFQALSRFTKA